MRGTYLSHMTKKSENHENFLRHCKLNGHLVTNDKLLGIIVNLDLWYGKDYDEGEIKSLERDRSGGYYDIREKAV